MVSGSKTDGLNYGAAGPAGTPDIPLGTFTLSALAPGEILFSRSYEPATPLQEIDETIAIAVPEPSTALLLTFGLVAMAVGRRRWVN